MADQETRLRWPVLCAILLVTLSMCSGFNLDPRFSVIKRGPAGSYFGYSVTEHQILNGATVQDNLLLVGAPKELVPLGGRTGGGAIYRCDATSTQESCSRINSEPFNNRPQPSETVEDQWMGVALHSSGNVVVTCAHRYIRENAALGICYTLLQNLEYQGPWIPCLGKPNEEFLQDFGLCQAGFSASIGQDDALLIGAPGSIYWRGVMFEMNVTDEFGADKRQFHSPVPVNPNEEGASSAQDPPTDKYSYLGYAVATGRFDASRNLYFVSGAPRSHDKGEVVFFRKMARNLVLRYEARQKLQGELDFSGFGSSLLAIDLNSDGFDELVVGAPYYYERGRGGAIYIYSGGPDMISNTSVPTVIVSREMSDAECEELGCEHARFGMSLSKMGDVNKDGYQDFAVGAPFEGKGTVYIYHGSKNGVVQMYAQRIQATDMPDGDKMKSFGHSLSGGIDLDNNGYPDLLVGAYESNQVALIRSRAIIQLTPKLTVTPDMIDLNDVAYCDKDRTARHCVELEICLSFTAEPKESFNSRPTIRYRVEAEKSRSFSRLEMVNSADPTKKYVEGSIQLYRQTSQQTACDRQLASLKEVFSDKLYPMDLTVTFSLDEESYTRPQPGDPLTDINQYPVLSTVGAAGMDDLNSVSTQVDFVKECGSDNKCDSNLQFEARLSNAPLVNGRYEVQGGGENSFVVLDFTITNKEEAAFLTRVYIQKPPGLTVKGTSGEGQDSDVRCEDTKQGDEDIFIVCKSIGNPLKTGITVSFQVRLTNKIETTKDELNITTWVNTSSTERTPENDRKVFPFVVIRRAEIELDVNVRPDDQILCSGDPRGVSAMNTEGDIGTAVNHTYVVTNHGPNYVSAATLTIKWPFEDVRGKYLLYLMEEPIVEKGKAECKVAEGDVNPEKIALAPQIQVGGIRQLEDQAAGGRSKRQSGTEARVRRAESGGDVVLSCKAETATCRKIICKLEDLAGNDYVQITLRSRLWESTLISDYRKSREVQISSYGRVDIDSGLDIVQDPSDDEKEGNTYAVPDFKDTGSEELKWWIILLAVLGGILLLIIIILILYKCGFFRRKRPEEMRMYQAQKKEQRMLGDDEEADT